VATPTAQERLFALEVKRACGAARVSQAWLGQQISLSRGKVSAICSGNYLPSHATMTLLVQALAMDRDHTFKLWRDACQARDGRRDDERRARAAAAAVVGWGRLPVLPPEISALLHVQELAADKMPYRLPGAKQPSLSTVFVRQNLGQPMDDSPVEARAVEAETTRQFTAYNDESPEFHRAALPSVYPARRLAVRPRMTRPPARTLREALDGDDHLLITGGPGQGKSTLTLRLAAEIASAWLTPDDTGDTPLAELVIPLRITARELAVHLGMSMSEALASSISAEIGPELKTPVPGRFLAEPVAGCRWLLLIDAIDEIAEQAQRDRLLDMLSRWAADQSDRTYRLVVTSRPLHGTGLAPLHRANVARYELQPFDSEALHDFAEHWFTSDDALDGELLARRFLAQIKQTHLDELTRVPLLATIAAIIFGQHRDRLLPDNRYDLYEEYLDFLARRDVPESRFDNALSGVRTDLLQHLAVTRLTTDHSLAQTARAWLDAHPSIRQAAADVRADLATYLTARGPLIARRDDIEFLHHSFADHLAATARARELPVPFDPEHRGWKEILHAARAESASTNKGVEAEAVLVHFCHLNRDQSDTVIRWLHDNTASFQLVAARLLAQRAPANAASIDEFLDTALAWAKTSEPLGLKILEQTCKATHHPPLAAWLHALMLDPDATWAARIQCANTLSTLFVSDDRAEALGVLHTALRDPTLTINDRVAAAQGLAELEAAQREIAADGLRLLLADPSADVERRVTAAVTLGELGTEAHADAVARLRSILDDPTTSNPDLRFTAASLAEIDPESESLAATVLRGIMRRTGHNDYQQQWTALTLGRLGAPYVDEAAALLTEIVVNQTLSVRLRYDAAAGLAELEPVFAPIAAGHLLHMLAMPTTPHDAVSSVVSRLVALGPAYRDEAVAHLRNVLADPTTDASDLRWTAESLSELGVEFHDEVVEVYRQVASDVLADEDDRFQALAQLAELGPGHRTEAITLLSGIATDYATEPESRTGAARTLIELSPRLHGTAAQALRSVMTDASLDSEVRLDAAISLAGLGHRFHPEIATVLHDLLGDTAAGVPQKDMYRLAQLGSDFRDQVVPALRESLHDPLCDSYDRAFAARQILDLDPTRRHEVVEVLQAMLHGDFQVQSGLVHIAAMLASLGADGRQRVVTIIRARLQDSQTDIELRRSLAEALAALGDDYHAEATTALHTILADPAADFRLRESVMSVLSKLKPESAATIAAEFHAVVGDTRAYLQPWTRLGTLLANRSPDHRGEVVSALRAVIADPMRDGSDCSAAAVTLGRLGQEFRDEAAAELRRLVCDRDQSSYIRVQAAQELVGLLRAGQPEATTCLLEIVADPCVSVQIRCQAGEQLVDLDRRHRSQVVRRFRSLLTGPCTSHVDALAVAGSLRRLNAIVERERHLTAVAVANDPTAPPSARRAAALEIQADRYQDKALNLLRALLWDRTAPMWSRIPATFQLAGAAVPLMNDVEAALREVLTGAEFATSDKLDALRELGQLSTPHRENATSMARAMIDSSEPTCSTSAAALNVLADFGGQYLHQAWEIADRILLDDIRPARARLAAAQAGLRGRQPRSAAVDYLRQATRTDPRAALRVDAATALVELGPSWRIEAVDELRRLVRDPDTNPYARQKAAGPLARWSLPDRTAAIATLDDLAGNPTAPPALRWRAAKALARHGMTHGHAAVTHLCTLMNDPDAPASARIRAAEIAVELDPSHIAAATRVLRDLAKPAAHRPAIRCQALTTLGELGIGFVDDAVAGLRDLARDETIGPTAQRHAAEAMARLHRDMTDEAALIIRAIVRSATTPPHIRWRAARVLARLSPTCRDEALDQLAALASMPWDGRSGR
jgi:hypothetical protein